MSATTPSPAQIKEYVASLREKHPGDKVFAIRSEGRWNGPPRVEIGSEPVEIVQCDTVLEIRERLNERTEESSPLILLTRLPQAELGGDVVVRLARRRLHELDSWALVMERFRAHEIDPRLVREKWIADVLAGLDGSSGFPVVPSGYLDADTVWGVLLSRLVGLRATRPDALELLRWAADPEHLRRYQAATGEFRGGFRRWTADVAGSVGVAILDCIESNGESDPLAVGLVCEVVHGAAAERAGELKVSAGRLERFHGNRPLRAVDAIAWGAAARKVIEGFASAGSAERVDRAIERTDALLAEIGAAGFAWVSDLSPLGYAQRCDRFAGALTATLAGSGESGAVLASAVAVKAHRAARTTPGVADRIDMSLRLVAWLSQASRESAGTLSEAAAAYVASGSFVDWARSALRGGEASAEMSAAYERLLDRAREQRERENARFGQLLAAWSAGSAKLDLAIPIEEILTRIVGPIAAATPVLLVVLDGMSAAVFHELLDDLAARGWMPLTAAKGKLHGVLPMAGIAAIPTITEVSRASLLSGEISRGGSSVEKKSFKSHPALLAASRPKRLPVLLHKADLPQPGGTELSSAARDVVAAPEQQVVGVVLNAIDDHLDNADQVRPRWSLDYLFQPLAALLEAARGAGRVVVLTSDHGHVLDADTVRQKSDFGDRWRVGDGEAGEGEVVLTGPRVGTAAGNRVIAPWSERIRYGGRKNGYHGGVSPQEVIVPIGVIAPPGVQPEGWVETGLSLPAWWEVGLGETEASTPATAPARRVSIAPRQAQLFSSPQPPKARTEKSLWIDQLVRSETYKAQKKLVGRVAPKDSDVAAFLATLEERGGKLTRAALGARLGKAPVSIGGVIAVMQRILNVDSYAIISIDQASDTVELNVDLLRKQFEIAVEEE